MTYILLGLEELLRSTTTVAARGVDSCDRIHRGGIFPGLLDGLLVVLRCFCAMHFSERLLRVEGLRKGQEVLGLELEVIEVLLLGDIETVLAVQELYHAAIGVANRGVVLDLEAFHTLDDTALQIPRTRCLDSSVDETFATSHHMEVVLLRAHTSQETVDDVTTSAHTCLVGLEAWQCLTTDHDRYTTTFQDLLTEVT
jgi:hypothetical protein